MKKKSKIYLIAATVLLVALVSTNALNIVTFSSIPEDWWIVTNNGSFAVSSVASYNGFSGIRASIQGLSSSDTAYATVSVSPASPVYTVSMYMRIDSAIPDYAYLNFIELLDSNWETAVRVRVNGEGFVSPSSLVLEYLSSSGLVRGQNFVIQLNTWYKVSVTVDCAANSVVLSVNDSPVSSYSNFDGAVHSTVNFARFGINYAGFVSPVALDMAMVSLGDQDAVVSPTVSASSSPSVSATPSPTSVIVNPGVSASPSVSPDGNGDVGAVDVRLVVVALLVVGLLVSLVLRRRRA